MRLLRFIITISFKIYLFPYASLTSYEINDDMASKHNFIYLSLKYHNIYMIFIYQTNKTLIQIYDYETTFFLISSIDRNFVFKQLNW